MKHLRRSLLILAAAGGVIGGIAQTSSTSSALSQAARPPYGGPVRGGESKRWEPWSAMRTAVTPVLGWKFGIYTGSFPRLDFDHALREIDVLGVANVEVSSTQKLDIEVPKYIGYSLAPGERNAIKDKLTSFNLAAVAYRVSTIDPGEDAGRQLFEFAKSLNIGTIVSERIPGDLALVDKLASEYAINVAVGGTMQAVLAALNGRSKHIGVFADTGVWLEEGLKPVEALEQVKDRLLVLNLCDRSAPGKEGHAVAIGTGVAAIPNLLLEMYRQG